MLQWLRYIEFPTWNKDGCIKAADKGNILALRHGVLDRGHLKVLAWLKETSKVQPCLRVHDTYR